MDKLRAALAEKVVKEERQAARDKQVRARTCVCVCVCVCACAPDQLEAHGEY